MLRSEWCTNNLFQKIKSKTLEHNYNILYHSHESIFDPLVMDTTNEKFIFTKYQNNQNIYDLNYNFTAINSLFINAEQIDNFFNTNTDIIIFNHDNLSETKREDLIILAKNTQNINVINFNKHSSKFIGHSIYCDYPIPLTDNNHTKTKDLLIFNLHNDNIINNIAASIKQKGIDVNVIKTINSDIESIYKAISEYKMVLDLNSRLNILCALACKCNVVTNIDLKGYPEQQDVTHFDSYDNIYKHIKKSLSESEPDVSYFKDIYSADNINNILQGITS